MKLKKIASLMLAGIMAVSMLAGCGEGNANSTPAVPEEPTATGVVSAVESGIKSWNSDLDIEVTESKNMTDAISKLFAENKNVKIEEDDILKVLNTVFDEDGVDTMTMTNSNFMKNSPSYALNTKGKGTYRNYAVIEVTNASGSVNDYAANEIGVALQGLENANKVDGEKVETAYTMYVCSENATLSDNSVVTYVIAVLECEKSVVI